MSKRVPKAAKHRFSFEEIKSLRIGVKDASRRTSSINFTHGAKANYSRSETKSQALLPE